jgi:hypothetical protein
MFKIKFSPFFIFALIAIFVLTITLVTLFLLNPKNLAYPQIDHSHFRLIIIKEGQIVDTSGKDFQEEYVKDVCSTGITKSPIHFHDSKAQIIHLHWQNITGGQVLKYYGSNLIGGPSDNIGYRLDKLEKGPVKVTTHSQALLNLDTKSKFWIYSGDQKEYKNRSLEEFLNKDLETFFGTQSSVKKSSKLTLIPESKAHNGVDDGDSEAELLELNNLLGNVVIFYQEKEPKDLDIKNQFNNLEPLAKSVCGG